MLQKGLFSRPLLVQVLPTNAQSREVCIHANVTYLNNSHTGWLLMLRCLLCLSMSSFSSLLWLCLHNLSVWGQCVPGEFAPVTVEPSPHLIQQKILTRYDFRNPNKFWLSVWCWLKRYAYLPKWSVDLPGWYKGSTPDFSYGRWCPTSFPCRSGGAAAAACNLLFGCSQGWVRLKGGCRSSRNGFAWK